MYNYLASLVLSAALAFVFFKAGKAKLTLPMDALAAAGLGWVKATTPAIVRLVGLLELLGVAGALLAPAAVQFFGFTWALGFGVAAAAGLALTMVVAIVLHVVRKEIKYTWKMNIGLLVIAVLDAVAIAYIA